MTAITNDSYHPRMKVLTKKMGDEGNELLMTIFVLEIFLHVTFL